MKISLAFASLLTLVCFAYWMRWDVPDGTRFNRAMQDLRHFQDVGIPAKRVWDPWGNDYVKVTVTVGGRTIYYMMSYGSDGKSKTFGHDPDDITTWTRSDVWIESLFPFRVCTYLMLFLAGTSVTLAALIALKGKRHQTATEQDVTPNA